MFLIPAKAVVLAAAAATVTLFGAAVPSIGVAISDGSIRINQAKAAGNASVFNGTRLETERPAQVRLNGGANLQFGVSSRAQLFSDHVDLQQGSARFSGVSANANGLSVRPDQNSSANVELRGKVVQVAALTGSVHVFNQQGVNVANLVPGRALNLTPQDAGAAAPSSLTGCVTRAGDAFTLHDETSNVTVQLRGGNPRAGRRAQVTGTTVANATAAGGATQVITVTNVRDLGSCNQTGAAAAGAGAGAAAGAGAGAAAGAAGGIGATTAVIAGVAAAGIGVGAGIAASNSGSSATGAGGVAVNPGCAGISPCTKRSCV